MKQQPEFDVLLERYNAEQMDDDAADHISEIVWNCLMAAMVIVYIVILFFVLTSAAEMAAKAFEQARYDAEHFNEWIAKD